LADWKGEAGSRAKPVVAARASIRAGSADSADIPRSGRERAEGFHPTTMTAVAAAVLSRIVTYTRQLSQTSVQRHIAPENSPLVDTTETTATERQ